ncbi:hypothetical protein GQ55_9G213800 [Panicum hallii var. hallii]|uniref:Uncharacterized protein n=1 Tax=Panicum hallii var. hallii TaxID=1504633 RepID=A0A2T7C5Q2_9POAL|nr:hypothetical protein GQ55_9G213800 [Panicum hallii var. hallii]
MFKIGPILELQVIFPALDIRVKNVAGTYSLEHKGEIYLFSQLFALLQLDMQNDDGLRRELASCTGAIHTCLSKHMSKEEEQSERLRQSKLEKGQAKKIVALTSVEDKILCLLQKKDKIL